MEVPIQLHQQSLQHSFCEPAEQSLLCTQGLPRNSEATGCICVRILSFLHAVSILLDGAAGAEQHLCEEKAFLLPLCMDRSWAESMPLCQR